MILAAVPYVDGLSRSLAGGGGRVVTSLRARSPTGFWLRPVGVCSVWPGKLAGKRSDYEGRAMWGR
jgi:hypothetical protein